MRSFLFALLGLVIGAAAGFYASGANVFGSFSPPIEGSANDDHLVGTPGSDVLVGKGGADIIEGGPGNDVLYGGSGSDRLFGEAGDDKLIGEAGPDLLRGGEGADWFVFKGAAAREGGDRIEDFEPNDLIVLEKLGVKSYSASGESGTVFARDTEKGDLAIEVVASDGQRFSIDVLHAGDITATLFSNATFIFSD
jgi:Ca2+-binding RTX toxin-like protein